MDECRITPYRDGPLIVRGSFKLTDQDGNEIDARRKTVALCRCGHSKIRPSVTALTPRQNSGPQVVTKVSGESEPCCDGLAVEERFGT